MHVLNKLMLTMWTTCSLGVWDQSDVEHPIPECCGAVRGKAGANNKVYLSPGMLITLSHATVT